MSDIDCHDGAAAIVSEAAQSVSAKQADLLRTQITCFSQLTSGRALDCAQIESLFPQELIAEKVRVFLA